MDHDDYPGVQYFNSFDTYLLFTDDSDISFSRAWFLSSCCTDEQMSPNGTMGAIKVDTGPLWQATTKLQSDLALNFQYQSGRLDLVPQK